MDQDNRKLYPLQFIPTAETLPWGGNSLVKKYSKAFYDSDSLGEEHKLDARTPVGGSWEIADLGFQDSIISDGWLCGNSISEIMDMYMDRIVGEKVFSIYGRQFPILVRFLDFKKRSPLIVNPDDSIAVDRYDCLGKSKLWYIVDAEPGSKLYLGFKEDISATDLYNKCLDKTILESLNELKPRKGQSFFITPGTVHCAEGGLLVAEIAESSDLDFKLCEWDSLESAQEDDSLTLVGGMDFINYSKQPEVLFPQNDILVDEPQFTVTRIALKDSLRINSGSSDSFVIYLCVEGAAMVQIQEEEDGKQKVKNYTIEAGESILIPAEIKEYILSPMDRNTLLLEAMIAQKPYLDPYINLDAEARLPDDDDEFDFLSAEDDPTDEQ